MHERDPAQDTGLAYHTLRGVAQLTLLDATSLKPQGANGISNEETPTETTVPLSTNSLDTSGGNKNKDRFVPGTVNVSIALLCYTNTKRQTY